MSDIIIKVENLSKQYRLGVVGTGTISHDLNRWWHKARGNPDPYLKVTGENTQNIQNGNEYVWALKNIDFEVNQGEVVGVIGSNGAGKSTLLKILSQVTAPTTGVFKARGRIASLLEVGTGFHQELTGRENIFLNGAILGMTKSEIKSKLDEIIDFSGVENYIDTPVKRYSSGMKVRLAFAVAAHLEPEILIVDEVLAVGDAAFQRKAIGKIKEVSHGHGRTVLFVSHNMTSITHLCDRGLVLKNGTGVFDGNVNDAISFYLESDSSHHSLAKRTDRRGDGSVQINNIEVYGEVLGKRLKPTTGKDLFFKFHFDRNKKTYLNNIQLDLRIDSHLGAKVVWLSTKLKEDKQYSLNDELTFQIPKGPLNKGKYYGTFQCSHNGIVADEVQNAFHFEVIEGLYYESAQSVPINQSDVLIDFNII